MLKPTFLKDYFDVDTITTLFNTLKNPEEIAKVLYSDYFNITGLLLEHYTALKDIPSFHAVFEMLYKKGDFKKNGFNEWLLLDLCLKNKIWNCLEVILTDDKTIPPRFHQIFKKAFLDACKDKESGDVTALMLSKIFRIKDHPLKNKDSINNGFILAIEYNNVGAVEAIIAFLKEHSKDFSFHYGELLYRAIKENKDIKIIEALLKTLPPLAKFKETFDKYGSSLLHGAVRGNNAQAIPLLCAHGASLEQTENNVLRGLQSLKLPKGETPLELARRKRDVNNEEVYVALLEATHNLSNPIDILSKKIMSPDINPEDISDYLRQNHGGKLPPTPLNSDARWLHFALKTTRNDLDKLLPMLISHGASCASLSRSGHTAAEFAAEKGNTEALLAIVDAEGGRNPNENGFYKALVKIVKNPQIENPFKKQTLQAIIQKHPDPTLFLFSVVSTESANLIKWFLHFFPADLDFKYENENIFEYAINTACWHSLEALLSHFTSDISIERASSFFLHLWKDDRGNNLLHYAAKCPIDIKGLTPFKENAKLFIRENLAGQTPLEIACIQNPHCVRPAIEVLSTEHEWRDNKGNNILHFAAKASLDITSLTLFKNHPELCLQFNHQNKKKTPLNIAAESKNWDNVLRCVEEMMKVIPHELKSTFVKEVLPSLIKEAKTQNMTTARESLKKYRPHKYAVKIFDYKQVEARLEKIKLEQDIIFEL